MILLILKETFKILKTFVRGIDFAWIISVCFWKIDEGYGESSWWNSCGISEGVDTKTRGRGC